MSNRQVSVADELDVDPDTLERDDAVIGRAVLWSLAALLLMGAVSITGLYAYSISQPDDKAYRLTTIKKARAREETLRMQIPEVPFVDVTGPAGITFTHENGAIGEKLMPEMFGAGCAFFDFDNDGYQDLLLMNSTRWPWDERPQAGPPPIPALYRNNGDGTFADVTAGSGLDLTLYGTGVGCGDYDNDGLVDVFLSAVGPDRLFHNVGGGKFVDVSDAAGVAGAADAWGASPGFFDYDNDGDLDLFVCNFVDWSREFDLAQGFNVTGAGRSYGGPRPFPGQFSYLYRNNGDGTFTDVSQLAGIQARNKLTGVPQGKSLAVTFCDVDDDGWIDIIVANDDIQNHLFHNLGNGAFREIGEEAGVAFSTDGLVRSGMGIDVAHFRNNDALGITIGNYANDMVALYVSQNNQLRFTDEAIATGLGPPTLLSLTFAVVFFDFDLDGRLDVIAINGHVIDDISRIRPRESFEQCPQLFWNCGPKAISEFVEVPTEKCGADFSCPLVGRGVSFADVDLDGDLDLVITNVRGAPHLLRNDQQLGNHWVRFKLTGTRCNRDAIGAWIDVTLPDRVLRRQVMPTRSYLSQVELPVTFGLGASDEVRHVTIRWPDGTQQQINDVQVDRSYEIQQSVEAAVPASHVQVSSDDG